MASSTTKLPRALWLLLFICVIGWAGRFVLPFLTLYMTAYLRVSVADAALIMSLFGLGGVLAVLMAGWLIDRFGARKVMVAALAGTGMFASLVALAGAQAVVVSPLILFLGLTSQAMAPAFNALVATIVPPERLRNAYSLVYMSMNVGFMLGPLLGGAITGVSYRLLFVAEATFMTIALLASIPLLRRSQRSYEPSAPRGNVAAELRATEPGRKPAGFRSVLSDRVFVWMCVLNICYMVIYVQPQITLPIIMQEEGFSTAQYGLLLSFNGALVVTLQLVADRLGRSVTEGRLLAAAVLVTGAGVAGHLFGVSMWVHALCVMVWTAGELINMPVATNVAARMAPGPLRGRYMGVFTTSTNFANFLGPLIGGGLLSVFGSIGLWVGCAVLALITFLGRFWNASQVNARMKEGRGN